MDGSARTRGVDPATMVIGLLLLALAGIIAWDAVTMRGGIATYGIGPKAMTYLVAGGLGLLGLGHLIVGLRSMRRQREQGDVAAVVWILAGLLALIFAVQQSLGFIAGVVVLFAATARGFRNAGDLRLSNMLMIAGAVALAAPLAVPMLGILAAPLVDLLRPVLPFIGWAGFVLTFVALLVPPRTADGAKDLAIAFVIGTLVYLAFTKLLTLSLPQGPLEKLF